MSTSALLQDDFNSSEDTENQSMYKSERRNTLPLFNWFHEMLSFEEILLACGIAIGAYLGAGVREGMYYYKIWRVETNYSIMYSQILGCFVMGFMVHHKKYLFEQTNSRFHRVLYTSITTGLCGCITTFSSWSVECNKSLFLQSDFSWGNDIGSYNGGRTFEWIVCMWAGVVVPMAALRSGIHVAEFFSPYNNTAYALSKDPNSSSFNTIPPLRSDNRRSEIILLALFSICTLIMMTLPTAIYESWFFLTFSAVLGFLGAYTRYQLSKMNKWKGYAHFPIGTFIANVFGTWTLGIFLSLSKYVVDYHNVVVQSLLFALGVGFCGCLTTVSTFVNEIENLPVKNSYVYGIATNLVAQVGLVLFLNIQGWISVDRSAIVTPPINFCAVSTDLCGTLLDSINCPLASRVNFACNDNTVRDYSGYKGICQCGTFSTNHIEQLVIDSQIRANISSNFYATWPNNIQSYRDPTQSIDYCMTFQSMCKDYLNHIGCPRESRAVNACDFGGLLHEVSVCNCEGHTNAGARIKDIISSAALTRRYDLLPYTGFITQTGIDMCHAYEDTCTNLLQHITCPENRRHVVGCTTPRDYSTFVGSCRCGEDSEFDVSKQVSDNLFDVIVKPNYNLLVRKPDDTIQQWDMCQSFYNVCSFFLESIDCPNNLRSIQACAEPVTGFFNGTIENYSGICTCGSIKTLSGRSASAIVDALLQQRINQNYLYLPQPKPPFTMVISTNPFAQLYLTTKDDIPL